MLQEQMKGEDAECCPKRRKGRKGICSNNNSSCCNYSVWSLVKVWAWVTPHVTKYPPTVSFIIRLMNRLMVSELREQGPRLYEHLLMGSLKGAHIKSSLMRIL